MGNRILVHPPECLPPLNNANLPPWPSALLCDVERGRVYLRVPPPLRVPVRAIQCDTERVRVLLRVRACHV